MQSTEANCGPAAASNALEAMGIRRSQAEMEGLCKTTAAGGTDNRKMLAGLRRVDGVDATVLDEAREDVAILRLFAALDHGQAVLLLVDPTDQDTEGSHWVAAVGLLGPRILVADSAANDLVTSYDKPGLCARWKCRGRRPYYGVIL